MANAPLTIRFATETAGAKSAVQDLAASIVSNMVKVSGSIVGNAEASAAGFGKVTEAFGTGARGVATAATTIVKDVGTIGAAGLKAANDSNVSGIAIGAAMGRAAAGTQTASVVSQGALAALGAKASFTFAMVRNEASAAWNILAASPAVMGGVAAIAGIGAIILALDAVDKMAKAAEERLAAVMKIASGAQDAGVGTSFYQRWLAEAKALNVETGKLEEMLARARAAATTRIGEGDKASSSAIGDRLQQNVLAGNLGKGDLARYQGADGQEARIRVILDLVDQLRQRGMQLAAFDLAGKMFGSDFEEKLRSGVDMTGKMRDTLDSIKATGGDGTRILSPDEVDAAQRLKSTLEETQRIMGDAIAPLSKDIAAYQSQAAQAAADFNQQLARVLATAMSVYGAVKGIVDAFGSIGTWKGWETIGNALGANSGINFVPGGLPITNMNDADRAAAKAAASGKATSLPAIEVRGDKSNALPSLKGGSSGGGSGAESDDQIERLIKQLDKANEQARAELATVGKTNVEREKALALAKLTTAEKESGRTATDAEREGILKVAEAMAQTKDKTKDAEQAIKSAADAMRSFGDMGATALGDMIFEGKSFSDVLTSIEKQIGKQLLSGLLTGTGPLAGILGTAAPASGGPNAVGGLLGLAANAFRANGGPMQAGRAYTVGEVGRELFIPGQDGTMVPISRGGGGMGGASTFAPRSTISVDARGSSVSEGQIRQIVGTALAENNRNLGQHYATWRANN